MVFLDFFEALLGCAEVYVVEASEHVDTSVLITSDADHQQTSVLTADKTPASPVAYIRCLWLLALAASCTYIRNATNNCTFSQTTYKCFIMKFSQGLSAANLQIYEILRKIAKN